MKSVRMFAVGLIVGAMLATTGSVLAASETVQATIAKLRFIVNGEERDVQTEQLVVMGTTYLPVREVANMLGYDVTYRADSKTIEFNKTEPENSKKNPVNRTPERSPEMNSTPEIVKHSVGEEFALGPAKLKLDGIAYSDRVESFVANPGDKFAIIKFDVLTESTPTHIGRLAANHFIASVVVDGIHMTQIFSTGESMSVKTGIRQSVEVAISIPEDSSVSSVLFRNLEDAYELVQIDL